MMGNGAYGQGQAFSLPISLNVAQLTKQVNWNGPVVIAKLRAWTEQTRSGCRSVLRPLSGQRVGPESQAAVQK